MSFITSLFSSSSPAEKPVFEMQVISDIHLEFDGPVDLGTPTAPYLALLGDIGLCSRDRWPQLEKFLTDCCSKWTFVFYVTGNHESYHGSLSQSDVLLRGLQQRVANFIYMDCDTFDVPNTDVRILGCTLWSDITDAGGRMLNDFVLIQGGFNVPTYRALHQSHVKFLETECDRAQQQDQKKKRIVVLTHHAPFCAGLVPDVSFGHQLLSTGCLGTELSTKFNTQRFPSLKAWCYGHTHLSKRTEIGGVKIISNQWGYPHDSWKTYWAGKLLPGYTVFDLDYKLQL